MTKARSFEIVQRSFGIYLVIVGLLLGAQSDAAGTRATPRRASVCDLATYPKRFDGLLVRVRGTIEGNGRNKMLIKDDACPELGVGLEGAVDASNDPNMTRMTDAWHEFRWQKESEQKTIRATIIGTYHYNEVDVPVRLLVMESVHNLTIR
jgi:hypothetical protein